MDSGWAVVIGAAIALVGSVVAPWLTSGATRRSERERERIRDRGDAIRTVVDSWYKIVDLNREGANEESADIAIAAARKASTEFALVLRQGEGPVYEFVMWVTGVAIVDSPLGTEVNVSNNASRLLFEWHWGERSTKDFKSALGSIDDLRRPLTAHA